MLKAQGSSRIHHAPTNSKGQTMELINVDLLEETIQFLDPVLKLMKIAGLIPWSFSTSSLRDKGQRLNLVSSKQQVAYTVEIWTGFSIIMVAYFFVLFRGGWQALGFSQMDVATVGVYSVLTFSVLLMVWKDHSALVRHFAD